MKSNKTRDDNYCCSRFKLILYIKYLDKKIKIEEAGGAGTSLEIMGNLWWNKRANLIYVRNEEVLFSSTAEFPTGSPMTDEQRKSAKTRGYIILDW